MECTALILALNKTWGAKNVIPDTELTVSRDNSADLGEGGGEVWGECGRGRGVKGGVG